MKQDEKHRYGQHYTPHEVAKLLAAFAVRRADDLVFDPSCGDGRLLAEALRLKHELSPRTSQASRVDEVFGVDRSASAIELAAGTGARVARGDFFDIEPGQSLAKGRRPNNQVTLPSEFHAIIGNPPYIRQEIIGAADKGRIRKRLARDRASLRAVHWPRWSGRSDIYVYFFAHAIRFLKEGGRLVFLTASSWLDAGYGAALREFMLNNFRVIAIVESAAEAFFEDASINTGITVLERAADRSARDTNRVRFARLNQPLGELGRADSLARVIARGDSSNGCRIRAVDQGKLKADGWGKYLRAEDVFFRIIERGSSRMRQLSEVARVRFGVKTGANEFFYVGSQSPNGNSTACGSGRVRRRNGNLRALTEVASVRRGLTTGANEFFYVARRDPQSPSPIPHPPFSIEPQYLSPVIFSLKEIDSIVIERASSNKMFFNCQASKNEIRGTDALRYIEEGELAGFDSRPTCAARDPWYAVARDMKPAPLIFPSKVGERWVVALNHAGAFEDKKLYGIFPAKGVSKLVLAALLNSTWARYFAEVTCRQMTGAQAIADIDVAVAEQILIPDPRALSPRMKKKLEDALMSLTRRPVYSIFDEVNRADRRRLDALVLEAIGFGKRARKDLLDRLYRATAKLVRARLSKSVGGLSQRFSR